MFTKHPKLFYFFNKCEVGSNKKVDRSRHENEKEPINLMSTNSTGIFT